MFNTITDTIGRLLPSAGASEAEERRQAQDAKRRAIRTEEEQAAARRAARDQDHGQLCDNLNAIHSALEKLRGRVKDAGLLLESYFIEKAKLSAADAVAAALGGDRNRDAAQRIGAIDAEVARLIRQMKGHAAEIAILRRDFDRAKAELDRFRSNPNT